MNGETSSETRRAEADHEARLADSREKRDLVMSKMEPLPGCLTFFSPFRISTVPSGSTERRAWDEGRISLLPFRDAHGSKFGVALSDEPWDFEKKGEAKGVGMIPHFTTLDMDAFAARLKEHGIPWLRQPRQESYGIEAFIEDPDGYQCAVLAPPKPSAR